MFMGSVWFSQIVSNCLEGNNKLIIVMLKCVFLAAGNEFYVLFWWLSAPPQQVIDRNFRRRSHLTTRRAVNFKSNGLQRVKVLSPRLSKGTDKNLYGWLVSQPIFELGTFRMRSGVLIPRSGHSFQPILSHILKICFNIIFPSLPRSLK